MILVCWTRCRDGMPQPFERVAVKVYSEKYRLTIIESAEWDGAMWNVEGEVTWWSEIPE